MAILGIGAVTIPLYQNNTIEDVEFILGNSNASAVIFEDSTQFNKLSEIKNRLKNLKVFVCRGGVMPPRTGSCW
jgi:long-chain acyl-CoA synthetase